MYSRDDEKGIKTQPYLPPPVFKSFAGGRLRFIVRSIRQGLKSKIVVLSHIDLLLPGYLVKLLSPKTKIILIAQGIEASKPILSRKKRMLKRIDLIIPLSDITKERMKTLFDIPEERLRVFNNCVDPFLPAPADESRRNESRNSYGIAENDFVLMTISRFSSKEKSRIYDKVLIAVKKLHASFRNVKYLFVGKYETDEKERIDSLIHDLGIEDDVIFTGFVPDGVLADFYNMSDVYIMPGEKEGFGFPFINALYYNMPVITGKSYGVSDHPYGNSLGIMIDLQSQENITSTIQKVMADVKAFMPDRELVMEKFGYPGYKNNWKTVIDELKVHP